DATKERDPGIGQKLLQTICAIANVGPDADGFLYIGIADKSADAHQVQALYGIEPVSFEHVKIVGVDREADTLKLSLDKYIRIVEDAVKNSKLTGPLRTQVLTGFDVVTYKAMTVVRIRIPRQQQATFLGDDCFIRIGTAT